MEDERTRFEFERNCNLHTYFPNGCFGVLGDAAAAAAVWIDLSRRKMVHKIFRMFG